MHYHGAPPDHPTPAERRVPHAPHQSPARDAALLDALTTGVLCVARDGVLRYANAAAAELLDAGLAPGRRLLECLPEADALHAALADADRERQGLTVRELELALGEGRRTTVDATLTPLEDGALLVELVALDRHRLIAREEALSQQHDTLREVVRGLAHEIKNPLGGLRGAAQLLDRSVTDPAARECARIILTEADRLRALVDALLGPARPLAKAPVNLHEVAEQVLAVVGHALPPRVQLVRDYDPSLPEAHAVRDHLVQALLNLVQNAAQALADQDGGRILLRTRSLRQYTLTGVRQRLVARLDVEDDGPGVPDKLRERLFYPLVSGRPDGSGLGLSIAQDLIARHGGLIEWESAPGRTVFSILLPLAGAQAEATHG
jgi:two-component system nitrogen regulation sensor histidine kinase GlnL